MLHAEFTSAALASTPLKQAPLNRPVVKASLVSGVYQQLLEAILSGALTPESELNEVALAGQLHVSRTPVHEALRRLTADGLVEPLPNGKSRVVTFTRERIVALYDMRKILEGAAAELAARLLLADRVTLLRQEANALNSAAVDSTWPAKAISFDLHFHDVIAESSGNEFLRKDILRHRRGVQGFCRFTGTPDNLRTAFEEHLQILEALERRDERAAQGTMVAHIEARVETLLRLLEQNPGGASVPASDHRESEGQ